MRYQKFRIRIPTFLSDLLSDALFEQGFEGVEIEDKVPLTEAELAAMYVDIPESSGEDDGVAYVSVFLPLRPDGLLEFGQEDGSYIYESPLQLEVSGGPGAGETSGKEGSDIEGTEGVSGASGNGAGSGSPGAGEGGGKGTLRGAITREEALSRIRTALRETAQFGGTGEEPIEISATEDADWENNWKDFFHAFQVGDLLIEPSWEAAEEAGAADSAASDIKSGGSPAAGQGAADSAASETNPERRLIIDPGAAFGTGSHETTRLCIEALQRCFSGGGALGAGNASASERENAFGAGMLPASENGPIPPVMLDIGTGSGILGITALIYGVRYVIGTDLDPQAVSASAENAKRNGFDEASFHALRGNVITDPDFCRQLLALGGEAGFPLITANILAEVLMAMAPAAAGLLAPGGILISSGILKEKAEAVCRAYEEAGLTVLETRELGDWAMVAAGKQICISSL